VLFEMLTGRPPFRRDNDMATLYAQIHQEAPAVTTAAPDVPAAFDDVLRRALAKDPDQRYPSAGDLARATLAAAHGDRPSEPERTVAVGPAAPAPPLQVQPPTPATVIDGPPSHLTAALPQARGSNPWPIVALVVVLALIAGAIGAVLLTRDDGGSSGGDSQAPVAQKQSPRQQQAQQQKPPADAALRADVESMGRVLDLSAEGRTLTSAGEFEAAATNREEVLAKIDALDVDPQLSESHALLRDAIDASLASNRAHAACGNCADAQAADTRATQLKARFARMFNPFAERYLQRSYDPSQI
jgi:hypothetical protein